MIKSGRGAAVLAAVTAGALALGGCGGGDGGSDPNVLTLWHYESPDSAMSVAWNQAIKEFEESHPGVTVKFEEKGFEQIQKTASMVLNSDEAPDIMEYNKGNATAGKLSGQGLLTDMTAEVEERGWSELIPSTVAVTAKYDDKGVMGGDKWFGIPNYAEYVMVYYNKDLFEEHDVEVPTTMAEFTAALDEFAAAGVTPLANAGAEYMAQQYMYQMALSQADRNWISAFQRYTAPVDFTDPAWTHGANMFQDWVEKGYIAEDTVGTKAEQAGVAFMSGEYPMMFSGSWWFGRVNAESKFDWGTFVWPEAKYTPGSSGNLWVVPKSSENKELAYDFIHITLQKHIQNKLGNSGGIPIAADPSAITDPKSEQLIADFNELAEGDKLAFYPDWPVPGFYDAMVAQVQRLMNGDAPKDALTSLQTTYEDGLPK